MNLIDLKQAPIVEKAQKGATLFALNTDGTVERISAENVGGGKTAVIKVDMSSISKESAAAIANLLNGDAAVVSDSGSATYVCSATCDTATFDEMKEIIQNGEKPNAVIGMDLSLFGSGMIYGVVIGWSANTPDEVQLGARINELNVIAYWTSDELTVKFTA